MKIVSNNGLQATEEAREYVKSYEEKLMKLTEYEEQLEFY